MSDAGSVARHLGIALGEYDVRIRTFIPQYQQLIDVTARALTMLPAPTPTIVDLGVGTGALAEACLRVHPEARLIGIDTDADMLLAAGARLGPSDRIELRHGSFLKCTLPRADAMVACLALHHIRDADAKQGFYRRVYHALGEGGLLVSGDRFLATDRRLLEAHHGAWLTHLERHYSGDEARAYLAAWAEEDTYFPLENEVAWFREAGFATDVVWRVDGFAVIQGRRPMPTEM